MTKKQKNSPEEKNKKPLTKDESEAFTEKANEERDEVLDEFKEIEKKYIDPSSEDLDQRAIGAWEGIQRKQRDAVRGLYKEAEKQHREAKVSSKQERAEFARKLLLDANKRAEIKRILFASLMESKIEGEKATTEEIAEIDKALKGLADFEKNYAHLTPLFSKIAEGGTLNEADYQQIIEIINPYDINTDERTAQKELEGMSAGIILKAMSEDQRVELLKQFKKSKGEEETGKLLDMFLSTGLIRDERVLHDENTRELLTGTSYEQSIQGKIESGQYKKEQEKIKAANEEHFKKYRGIYNENINNRVWGRGPFFGALAMLWGTATFAVNMAVSRKKGENPIQWMGRAAKNPYVWLGLGAVAGGAEVMSSTLKSGELIGGGIVSRFLEKPSDEEKVSSVRKRAKKELKEMYPIAPKALKSYLANGGFTKIQELRAEVFRTKNSRSPEQMKISIDELLENEKDPEQKRRLASLKSGAGSNEADMNEKLTTISEAGYILQIKNNADFMKIFNKAA